ncbi:MAG: short chain dehydrogenase, partial [Mycobacterium sp.]
MSSSTNAIDLAGKVAVVTGAAAGLGRAEAIGLA